MAAPAATGFTIDLRRYKDRQGSRIPEADYRVEVSDAEISKTKAGDPMVTLFLKVASGAQQGKTLVDRLTIKDTVLWRVVAFLKAVNIPTPNKQIDIQLRQIIGKQLMVTVEDGDPYPAGSSNIKSEVRGYAPLGGPAKAEPADDLADEDEDDDFEDDDEADEEPEPVAVKKAPVKKATSKPDPEPEPEEDEDEESDDDEDDEDEEEPPPPPVKRRRAAKPAPPADDEDDDEDGVTL